MGLSKNVVLPEMALVSLLSMLMSSWVVRRYNHGDLDKPCVPFPNRSFLFRFWCDAWRVLHNRFFFPGCVKHVPVHLKKLGFHGQSAGIALRPVLPYQVETARAVRDYIARLDGARSFHLSGDLLIVQYSYNCPDDLAEIPPATRILCYQKLKKRARCRQNEDQ